jgi:hypothetical protein
MEFTLDDFEARIDPMILARGQDYWEQGRVADLEPKGEEAWRARVEGTESYLVELGLEDDGSVFYHCTCPYDAGPVCKHVVAVLLAITQAPRERDESEARHASDEALLRLLDGVPHGELVQFLMELAHQDHGFADQLRLRYGGGETGRALKRMVRRALSHEKDRQGFLDYWGAARAARAVQEILDQADARMRGRDPVGAASIYQAVFETVIPAVGEADDSMGTLADCIYFALGGLKDAGEAMGAEDRRRLFDYCLETSADESILGWDWPWDLAKIAAGLIQSADDRRRLFETLDKMVVLEHARDESSFHDVFTTERAEEIKLSVIEMEGDPEAVRAFLETHTEFHSFRERLARLLIKQGELEAAKQITWDWLDSKAGSARGLRGRFLGILLDIAMLEGDEAAIMQLGSELFLDTGDFKIYDMLKRRTPREAWPERVEEMLVNAQRQAWRREIVPGIYIREEMWDGLLELAKRVGRRIFLGYREYLEPRFPQEMCNFYEEIVKGMLEHTSNRGVYGEAAEYLRRMGDLEAAARALQLIRELAAKYRNRPAMIDELGKVERVLRDTAGRASPSSLS